MSLQQSQPDLSASTEQRSQTYASLMRIAAYMVSVLDPEELQAELPRQVVQAVPELQAAMLWVRDPQQGLLRIASCYGLDLDESGMEVLQRFRLRSGEGAAGTALQNTEPLQISGRARYRELVSRLNPSNSHIYQQLADRMPRVTAAICIPMRLGQEPIGVLELLRVNNAARMESADLQMLQSFGNLAAGAISNARLYQQTESHRRRLDAFESVVTAISTAADLDELIRSVLEVLLEVVGTSGGLIYQLDNDQMHLALAAQQGLPAPYIEQNLIQVIAGSACENVVRYAQPVRRELFQEQGEQPLLNAGFGSCAYLPLLAGGTVTGVLGLYGDTTFWTRVDLRTLMPLCNHIGFAVANVRLYEENRIERRRLYTVISSIAEGVLLFDRLGRLELANEAALRVLGTHAVPSHQTLDELRDLYDVRRMNGDPMSIEEMPFARALKGEIFTDERILIDGASGPSTVVSCSIAPTHADDGDIEGAVVVLRDITNSLQLEKAKDEFLTIAAHELRSPLAAVRGYTDLLIRREQRRLERGEAASADVHGLNTLAQQVSHMLQMVDNLLDVSRLQVGQLGLQIERTNLLALVRQVVDQQRLASTGHRLDLETDLHELWLYCDSLRIRQALINLISNAFRYSPSGSLVRVQVDRIEQPDADCLECPLRVMARVAVIDQGPGIPDSEKSKLFQRYSRTRMRSGEGLGLGLFLTREFVQLHQGQIDVESRESQGSTFWFTLPIGEQEQEEE